MTLAFKICSLCKAEKPSSEFYPRKERASGFCSRCKACSIAARSGSESARLATKKWQKANWLRVLEARKRKASENPERKREMERRWYRNNPARFAKKRIDRRQSVKQATPAWSNTFIVEEAYRLARLRTQLTGIKWHVDHIVPLKGAEVCGLHAHTNVQVIPAVVNHAKSNRLSA